MLDAYETYKNSEIINYLKEYPAKMIDANGNITGYEYKDFNLDNVRTAKFILRMNNLQPAIQRTFYFYFSAFVQLKQIGSTFVGRTFNSYNTSHYYSFIMLHQLIQPDSGKCNRNNG